MNNDLKRLLDILDDASDCIGHHIGSSHSDTDNWEVEIKNKIDKEYSILIKKQVIK